MARKDKVQFIFTDEVPHSRLKRFFAGLLVLLLFAVAGVLTALFLSSNQVALVKTTITVQELPSDLESFSILLISDLNGKYFGKDQKTIEQALGSTKRYSCVVFAGDMVGESGNVQPFLDLIDLLPADIEKFMIAGDRDPSLTDSKAHGSLSVYSDWVVQVQEHGVKVLDEPYKLTRGKKDLWLVPESLYTLDLDSYQLAYRTRLNAIPEDSADPDTAALRRLCEYELEKVERIRAFKAELKEDDVQICVSHVPMQSEDVSLLMSWQNKSDLFSIRHVGLFIAGHTCGGDWCLPDGRPILMQDIGWLPDRETVTGRNWLSGIPCYTTPGLSSSGMFPLPGRLFNKPEISLIYLTGRIQ